jgi:hypothetical protein
MYTDSQTRAGRPNADNGPCAPEQARSRVTVNLRELRKRIQLACERLAGLTERAEC